MEGTALSLERLVDSLKRVFPLCIIHQRAVWVANMLASLREVQEPDNEFEFKLKTQLYSNYDALTGEIGRTQR